ncbi:MAG: hypothetical protein WKG07_11685 [Hymenobacter sp.]
MANATLGQLRSLVRSRRLPRHAPPGRRPAHPGRRHCQRHQRRPALPGQGERYRPATSTRPPPNSPPPPWPPPPAT